MSTCAVTGTATATITEGDVVAGSKTIILTLTGDTFIAAGDTWCGQQGTAVFYDGFEDGTHNAWGEENGTVDVVSAPGYTGDCGSYVARSTIASTGSGFIGKTLSSPQSEVYVGFKVALTTNILVANQWETVWVLELYESGETNFLYVVLQASNADKTVGTVGINYNGGSLTTDLYDALNMSATTYYQFKIHIKAGTGNAEIKIWYRTQGGSWTALGAGLTNATFGNVTNIRAGRTGGTSSAVSGYIYVDDVQVSATDVWGP